MQRKLRRFHRYSLRALLTIIFIVAILGAVARDVVRDYHDEQSALQSMRESRCPFSFAIERPRWVPTFLDERIASYFDRVIDYRVLRKWIDNERGLVLFARNFTDDHVAFVIKFKKLKRLSVAHSRITVSSLRAFSGLRHLDELNISYTDAALLYAVREFQQKKPGCLICCAGGSIDARLSGDGSVSIQGETCRVNDASEFMQLIRQHRQAADVFGYGQRMDMALLVHNDVNTEQRREWIDSVVSMSTTAGVRHVQVIPE